MKEMYPKEDLILSPNVPKNKEKKTNLFIIFFDLISFFIDLMPILLMFSLSSCLMKYLGLYIGIFIQDDPMLKKILLRP